MYNTMKNLRFLLFLFLPLLYADFTNAQSNNDTADVPYWIDMMQDNDVNFYDVQRAFNLFWENRPITKGSGWKPFKRWEYMMESRVYSDGTRPRPDEVWNEYEKYISGGNIPLRNSSSGNWTELGPVYLPANGTSQPNGLGRVNCLGFHPENEYIIWAGAPSGGLWKTTDGGVTWTSNTDALPTLGVSSIVINYRNPDTMFIGTGDRDANDASGLGVMISSDGGETWAFRKSGMNNRTVGMMLMHPQNPDILLAASSGGIFRSSNAGASWTRVSSNTSNYKDLRFHPANPDIVYATAVGDFYRSDDNGLTWTQITSGLPGSNRLVIGVTPHAPDIVYLLLTNYRSFKGFYKSSDAGLNFTLQSDSPNIMDYSTTGSDNTRGQAFYNLCIAVDPKDSNTIYSGGVNIFKSSDGGVSWQINAHWTGSGGAAAIHADQHCSEFHPINNKLYAGNDGGVYFTDDGGQNWTDISSGLAIAQVYKIGQSKLSADKVINGYQDNGTAIYEGNWNTVIGGDGFECIYDYTDENYVYGALYYGDIRRSITGGNGFWQIAGNGKNGITESGAWVTPYILHESDPNTMFIGYKNVWRSKNVKENNTGNINFTKISNNLSGTNGSTISVLENSPALSDILYMARSDRKLFRTDNAMDTEPIWHDLTAGLPDNYAPTDIEAHPTDPYSVYITLNRKVYKSIDTGRTWTNISGSLPNISINTIVYDTESDEGLYVGTDAGVYYKDANMSDWIIFSQGLPVNGRVTELEIYNDIDRAESRIRASTYGRGLWSSELYYPPNTPPKAKFEAMETHICESYTINFKNNSSFAHTYHWSFPGGSPSSSNDREPVVQYNHHGIYDVRLVVENDYGVDTVLKGSYINVDSGIACIYIMPPVSSGDIYYSCNGKLYDPGGTGNYDNNQNVYVTIAPPMSSGIILDFESFAIEDGPDFLEIYQGPDIRGTLIGRYTGYSLPEGGRIIVPDTAVTIRFVSNYNYTAQGFVMNWRCVNPDMPPIASFSARELQLCSGEIEFNNQSLGFVDQYFWDFGDGKTSTQSDPIHQYERSGLYEVKLVITNANGIDTFVNSDISIQIPPPPDILEDAHCGPGVLTLEAQGDGLIQWFRSATDTQAFNTGNSYTTPNIAHSETYYVQMLTNSPSFFVGPKTNNFGSYITFSGTQGLVFDVYKELTLKSVKVYATGDNHRTMVLLDQNDDTLARKTVYVNNGEQRVDLNFDIAPGTDYKLIGIDPLLTRNKDQTSFPYKIDDLISIKTTTLISNPLQYYYFFYDWEVQEKNFCKSVIIPIVAHIHDDPPTAGFSYMDTGLWVTFTDASSNVAFYTWVFGEGTISKEKNPVHKFPGAKQYTVTLSVENGCGKDSITKVLTIISSVDEKNRQDLVRIYPNPNTGDFIVEYQGDDLLHLMIYTINGVCIFEKDYAEKASCPVQEKLNMVYYPKGVYILKLISKKGPLNYKVIIE
jgi:PKD repeat protein